MKKIFRKMLVAILTIVVAFPVTVLAGYITAGRAMAAGTVPSLTTYTVSDQAVSPNGDGVKDTTTIDLAFSEQVKVNLDILDSSSNKVKDLYSSTGVTNPTPKTWDGTNNSGATVVDGIYIISVNYTDTDGDNNNIVDTSKTITVSQYSPVASIATGLGDTIKTVFKSGDQATIALALASPVGFSVAPKLSIGSFVQNASMTPQLIGGGIWAYDYSWTVPAVVDQDATLSISAVDDAGNQPTGVLGTTAIRIDNTKPVITMTGSASLSVDQYSNYSDAGATASDTNDGDLTKSIVAAGSVDTKTPGVYQIKYDAKDEAGNSALTQTRTVTVVAASVVTPADSGVTTAITAGETQGTVINIAKNLGNEVLDLSALPKSVVDQTTTITTEHQINANLATEIGQIQVAIPAGTKVSGDNWNGQITLPEIVSNPTLSTLAPSDFIVSGGTTINLGLTASKISFDQPVSIVFTGLGGKRVGYIDQAGKFTEIATACDNATNPTTFSSTGECKIATNNGADLTVWTKHFTGYVAYSAEQVVAPSFTSGGVDKSGSRYIDVAWTGVGGGVDYEVKINGSVVATVSAGSDLAGVTYSKEFGPYAAGNYTVLVRSVKSGVYSNSTAQTVNFAAVTSTVSTKSALVSKVSAANTVSSSTAATAVSTPSDSSGIIKGTNSTSSQETDTTNWTPWVILFTLIVLAGAVTGGYFYWFAGKEEVEKRTPKGTKEKVKVVVRDKKESKKNKTKPGKKQNRW